MSIASQLAFVRDLQDDFDVNIATPNSLEVSWPNAPFTIPAFPAPWARATILFGDAKQTQMGAPRRYRRSGQFVVNLFARLNFGEASSITLADTIAARYRTATRAGAQFNTPVISAGERDGGFWRLTVACPFYAESNS